MLLACAIAINIISNKEFSIKPLEDQQKVCVAFIRLISTLGALGHCVIRKYIYQNWMERVSALTVLSIQSLSLFLPLMCCWICSDSHCLFSPVECRFHYYFLLLFPNIHEQNIICNYFLFLISYIFNIPKD